MTSHGGREENASLSQNRRLIKRKQSKQDHKEYA